MQYTIPLIAFLAVAINAAPQVSQILDGQVQAPSATKSASMSASAPASSAPASSAPSSSASATSTKAASTATPVTQIADGQIQAGKSTPAKASSAPTTSVNTAGSTVTAITQITDGQVQAPPATMTVVSTPSPSMQTVMSTAYTTVTSCTTPTQTATTMKTSATPSPTPSSVCLFNLPSSFEYPHSIVPSNNGGATSFNAAISSTVSTTFTFDIPAAAAGKTCTTTFAIPAQGTLQTSSYTLSGSGTLDFYIAGQKVSSYSPTANSAFTVASGACAAGQQVVVTVQGTGSVDLKYFQDYNPCPIGLYVVPS